MVYKAVSLAGEEEITLGRQTHWILLFVSLNYDFHHILLQLLCLQHVISDNIIDNILSFYTGGDYTDIFLFYISVKYCLESSCS